MVTMKIGTPTVKVSIWTDDLKITLTASIGDYNSDILEVTTNKDINSPNGTFTIVFVSRVDTNQDWFTKLDAFDYVEIEFCGINDNQKSQKVMRGLIDRVSKNENWDNERGLPDRSITINGRDLGCIFTDHQVHFIAELSEEATVEAALGLIAWNVESYKQIVNAAEAFQVITDKINKSVNLTFGGGQIALNKLLQYKTKTTFPEDLTTLEDIKMNQGAFWNALSYFKDHPFHELILYDLPTGPFLVLRPTRWKDIFGNYHTSVDETDTILYPPNFTFSDADLVTRNLSKSTDEVYNYYWTYPKPMQNLQITLQKAFLDIAGFNFSICKNPVFQNNQHLPAYVGKYGLRYYEATTAFVIFDTPRGETAESNAEQVFIQRGIERNEIMVAWMLHNEHLLSGQIVIPGTNQALVGTYVTNTSDNMEYYVEGVTSTFQLFRSFRTTLNVSRGQLSAGKGGLVGLANKDNLSQTMNRFYFSKTGVVDTYG